MHDIFTLAATRKYLTVPFLNFYFVLVTQPLNEFHSSSEIYDLKTLLPKI